MVLDAPDDFTSVVSAEIVSEWRAARNRASVLDYFRRSGIPVDRYVEIVEAVEAASDLVEPIGEPPPCRDENDRKYLHCVVTAQADYLVTTDLDVLVIERIGETEIVRPGALWQRIGP